MIDWVNRLKAEGVALPVHIGVAGPAKLQTLIKFAIACGVSFMLSGYYGLYSSQKIMYSKLRAEYINIHAK